MNKCININYTNNNEIKKELSIIIFIYDILVLLILLFSIIFLIIHKIIYIKKINGRIFPKNQQQHNIKNYKNKTKQNNIIQLGYEWETEYKKIKFKKKIGHGNFGEIWEAIWLGSPVAVKMIRTGVEEDLIQEIKLMSCLHHPNIVMFLGACLKPPNICLLLELCVHDHLLKFLQSEEQHCIDINMRLLLKLALDIARGLNYLHQKKGIIQRDIKSRNILVDENLNAKIADFGLSRKKVKDNNGMTACGTPAWTAPEVIRMQEYTEKVDVYSFAIVLWELLVRDEPYNGDGGVQIAYAAAEQGLRPQIPDFAPQTFANLIRECWSDNPDKRPDFTEILERLFEMMKDESNPDRAAHFYFGQQPSTVMHLDESQQKHIFNLLKDDNDDYNYDNNDNNDDNKIQLSQNFLSKLYTMKSVQENDVWGNNKQE